jgi:hypothetical protein
VHLVWLLVSLVIVVATFTVTYINTGNIWDAMNAAAIPLVLFIAGLTIRATRPPVSKKWREIVVVLVVFLLSGAAVYWGVMRSMTLYQFNELQLIRKQIENGAMTSMMYERASNAFAAYYRQPELERKSLAAVFEERNLELRAGSCLLAIDTLHEGIRLYASRRGDARVVMTAVSGVAPGRDGQFKNYDGRTGFMEAQLVLTPKGLDYEIHN